MKTKRRWAKYTNYIDSFSEEFAFLSNFYRSDIIIAGTVWPTSEHVFQAAKTRDPGEREAIRQEPTPGKAKRHGRKVSIREDWEEIKEEIMLKTLRLKFSYGTKLAEQLIDTQKAFLVEGNTWCDQEWGNCICELHKEVPGKNTLGKLLMQVRDELNIQYGNYYDEVKTVMEAYGFEVNFRITDEKRQFVFSEQWDKKDSTDAPCSVLLVQTKRSFNIFHPLSYDEDFENIDVVMKEIRRLAQ